MKTSVFAPPWQAAVAEGLDPAARELRAKLERDARNCSRPRHGGLHLPFTGVGSSLSYALRPLTKAYTHGVTLKTPKSASGTPISQYGLETLDYCLSASTSFKPLPDVAPVPAEFASQGLFWWTSQQWAWLLRPGPRFGVRLDELKRGFQWEENRPILGLHVRHGDSCTRDQEWRKARRCESLAAYMPAVRELARNYGYKAIYLATDDADVMRQAPVDFPEFKWFVSPSRTAQGRSPNDLYDDAYRDGKLNTTVEYREVLTDLLMLADTDGFVGKFTSNIDRIAVSLGFGRRGCAVPMVSLDSLWCNDWGRRTGVSVLGRTFSC